MKSKCHSAGLGHMTKSASIAVIESDAVQLEDLSLCLRHEGYEVFEARSGAEGLRMINQHHPQLVLLALELPDQDGRTICQMIKGSPGACAPSVILMLGEDADWMQTSSGPGAADEILVKPFARIELFTRVRSALLLRAASKALRVSSQYYGRLLQALPDGLLVVSSRGELVHANPQAVAMLGYSEEIELVKRSAFGFVQPQERDRFRALLGSTLATADPQNEQFTLVRKNGQPFAAELSAASLRGLEGIELSLVLVLREMSFRAAPA